MITAANQITLSVLVVITIALTVSSVPADLLLLGGLTVLLVTGVVDTASALEGFANPGLATVAVLFVVAEGLKQTGGMNFVGAKLLGEPKSLRKGQATVMFPVAILSAFLNNTPVVAMMVPVIGDWAKKFRLSVSYLFLPLSYATILGGLCTLIGTSTTLVIDGKIRQHVQLVEVDGQMVEQTLPGFSMFELSWVGLPCAFVGLGYLLLFSKKLLPDRRPAISPLADPREYTVEMIVEDHPSIVGKTIEAAGLRHLPSLYLMEIDRGGHILPAVSSDARLEAGDRLIFVGIVESIVDLQKIAGLSPATNQVFKLDSPRSDRVLIEAVVSDSFPNQKQTIRESRFRSRYNAAVIAVARNGERLNVKIGDIQLQPGDTLLLETHESFLDVHRNSRDFFLVSRVEGYTPPRHELAWFSQLVLLAMVIVVATGLLDMLKASLVAASMMVLSGCCKGIEARRSIDWGVLLVIGAGLGIGEAMSSSGTDILLADGVIRLAGTNPYLILAVLYATVMVLTNLITAKAAAVLILPIVFSTAEKLAIDPMPLLVGITIAAAASFATPIGYQTNLMVFGPGGYKSSDYLRLGGPLSLIVFGISMAIIPFVWHF
ncbi:MAG: SLC13 family permease [Planctomycetaceae bacterium]|jgi:di/tricarboxylate transporter|nr:SLC13 family permease [Planctomycetaceae bacterium]MDG2390123.1 SLC13 family permease [Planctomycetaceae bacterium]